MTNDEGEHNFRPEAGYVPDAETAMTIAEAVWLPIYGTGVRPGLERPEGLGTSDPRRGESLTRRSGQRVSRLLRAGERPFVLPLEGPGGPTVYGAIGEILERHEREAGGIRS